MSRFENATDAEIIARSEQDLNALARKSGTTLESTLADESGVDDEAVRGFPTVAGMPQVTTGRTGQTGGGTNAQIIPPEEGGLGGVGVTSDVFERAEDKDAARAKVASENPGGVNVAGDGSKTRPRSGTKRLGARISRGSS